MRTIVQISMTRQDGGGQSGDYGMICALCDDGTLWIAPCDQTSSGQWTRIRPIPQDEAADAKGDE